MLSEPKPSAMQDRTERSLGCALGSVGPHYGTTARRNGHGFGRLERHRRGMLSRFTRHERDQSIDDILYSPRSCALILFNVSLEPDSRVT